MSSRTGSVITEHFFLEGKCGGENLSTEITFEDVVQVRGLITSKCREIIIDD